MMPRFCSVLGCGSNHARDKVSFHRFPSIFNNNRQIDPLAQARRKKWIEALRRSDLTETKIKYGFVCGKHFIGGAPSSLSDTDNPDWIPTQNMGYPTNTWLLSPVDPLDVKPEKIEELPLMTQVEDINHRPSNKSTSYFDNKDQSESIRIRDLICRLCMEEKPDMWLFNSILTFEDQSTLDMVQVFQNLTQESTEKVENPRLPKHICKSCVDLLINAHYFREKYEKSCGFFTKFLSASGTCIEGDAQSISNEVECKPEREEVNGNSDCNNTSAKPLDTTIKGEEENLSLVSNENLEACSENEVEPVKKLHRCPVCLKEFTALELKQHCRSHKALKSYFNAAPRFNKKVKFYAKPRNNTCLYYRETVSHVCPFCSEEFNGEQFKEHIKLHRTEGNYRCNICNRIFIGRNHLKMHQLYHRQETPFNCKECGKGFFRQKNFDFHMLRHTAGNNLPFKCEQCSSTFSNPEHLKRHVFGHEKSISYVKYYKSSGVYVNCKQCRQKFKTKAQLDEHSCRFCCVKCYKIFDNKKEFSAHVCKHTLKPAQCQPCGKVFQLPTSYKAHKYRCGNKTLCYICGKNVSNITQHMLSHYPQKRGFFTCAHCGKQFRWPMSLNRHVTEVHLNLTCFKCQYCPKGFKSKWNLTVHERIHLGEKNHVCPICGKKFLEKSYLQKHLTCVHLRKKDRAEELKDRYMDDFWTQKV